MSPVVIILIALWTYPLISYLALRLTTNRLRLRRRILIASGMLAVLALAGLVTNVSTTSSTVDWFFVSAIYLFVSLFLLWARFQNNRILKVIGTTAIAFVFGLGYLSASVGILGVGFTVADYEPDFERRLDAETIYREFTLGNVGTDYRIKKVELYKTISWFPLFEWRTHVKEYSDLPAVFTTPLTIDYKPMENKLYLSASTWWQAEKRTLHWADTLKVN